MLYCKSCLQPDTRPNTKFRKGICPACLNSDSFTEINWDERNKELEQIVDFGKENSDSGYDCIIGVSGGKDSTRQALFVKEKLKMNPLLICLSPPPQEVSQRGVENLSNLINKGFDCITINPAPETWKKLMYISFYKYLNPFKSTELALHGSVPRLAIAYQIPLIWWGENPATQVGDSKVMGETGYDGNQLKKMNTLNGGDISWIINKGFSSKDILQYEFPSEIEMKRANLKTVFLGYFWMDWSIVNNGDYSALRGLDIRNDKPWEMGDHLGIMALDEDWTPMNQMLKYLKFGFGRTTEIVNDEIRNKKFSREDGIELVKLYDGKCSEKYILSFCEFIGIDINEFWKVVEDRCLNKKLFKKISQGVYEPKFNVGIGL